MKKFIFIIMVALFAVGCDDGFYTPRDNYPNDNGLKKYTEIIEVKEQDWMWNSETGTWWFEFQDIEYLTPYVIDNGLYYMYYQTMDGSLLINEGMPVVTYEEEDGTLWEYNIACTYGDYNIKFDLRDSDFEAHLSPPTMRFRLVVIW